MPPTRYAWITLTALAVVLGLMASPLFAQQGTGRVRGTVTDSATQAPIPNAHVSAIGTSARALTNSSGEFVLTGLPAGTVTIRAQSLGYAPEQRSLTLAAGDTTSVTIALRPTAQILGTVVVQGYGTTTRSNVSSAIASLDSTAVVNNPVASLDDALQGKIPGVYVSQNSGDPGTAMSVRIRGPSSISASDQPLYVVDGTPVIVDDVSQLDLGGQGINGVSGLSPNEIESIDVLKDAAATAIYGSRGSNGVILITTKRGRAGKGEVTFNAYAGSQWNPRQLSLMNSRQYLQYQNQARLNDGYDSLYYGRPGVDDVISTDWQGSIMRNAPIGNLDLGVSGGTDQLKYRLGGSYYDQTGIIRSSGYTRYNGRGNLDFQVTPRFGVGASIGLSHESDDRVFSDASSLGVLTNAIGVQPLFAIRNVDGTFSTVSDTTTSGYNMFYPNPVALQQLTSTNALTTRMLGNIEARYDILPSLRYTGRYGFDQLTLREDQYQSPNVPGTDAAGLGGVAKSAYSTGSRSAIDNYLTWNAELGERSALTVTGGNSIELNNTELNFIRGEGLSNDLLHQVRNASRAQSWDGAQSNYRLISWFGRANYTLAGKYIVSGSLRADGSSRFGPNNRWGVFPAASVAWNISEEPFLKGTGWLDNLKLRASYGLTGNQSISNYPYQGLVQSCDYAGDPGLCPSTVSNPNLKWESTKQFDAGVDMFTFRGRLGVTADYYEKHTNDLLLLRPVPSSSGYTSLFDNVGSMQNKGFELAVNTVNVENVVTDGFRWSTSFNVALNRNKVTKLADNGFFTDGVKNMNLVQVGQPLGAFYAFKFAGVDPQTGNALYFTAAGDTTSNPVSTDRFVVGNPYPSWTGGLTNTVQYRNWDLNVGFITSRGNKVFNATGYYAYSGGRTADNQFTRELAYWRQPGDITNEPRPSKDGTSGADLLSNRFIEDGSYVRLNEVTLGYRLPTRLTRGIGLQSARLYVGGHNLHTWTKYSGYDPDLNTSGNANVSIGTDFYTYPIPRSITFGISGTW